MPSSGHLGGTSLRTRELILLCEAAGYDVVIVETVGVGQSETEVSRLVDCFISLQIAGGGDDLQGIKKGSMEMADIVVINKDDGENRASVAITRHMYESALHILRRKHAAWQPRVLSCSAAGAARYRSRLAQLSLTSKPPSPTAAILKSCASVRRWSGLQKQAETEALHLLFARADFDRYFQQTLQAVKNNGLSPRTGLRQISEFLQNHYFA